MQLHLVGMSLGIRLGVVKNQAHILTVQQCGRVDIRCAEQASLIRQIGRLAGSCRPGHIIDLCVNQPLSRKILAQIHPHTQPHQLFFFGGIILNQLLCIRCHGSSS